jgi:hypothetical protein
LQRQAPNIQEEECSSSPDSPPAESPATHFTEQDILTVFSSIETACQWAHHSIKQRKTLSNSAQFTSALHPSELNFMKRFFARMASLHLSNPLGYEKLKLFLLCPYDLVVSQMADLGTVVKPGIHANAIRESLCMVILLHRDCTTRGQICRHLKYLMGKVVNMETQEQRASTDLL